MSTEWPGKALGEVAFAPGLAEEESGGKGVPG